MPTSPNGIPYPALGDDANGPEAFQAQAEKVDELYGAMYADVASLPVSGDFPGQHVWVDDTDQVAVWNGAAWVLLTPGDSGWVACTTAANISGTAHVRKIGHRVHVRSLSTGGIARSSGGSSGTFQDMFTVPAGFRPPSDELLAVGSPAPGSSIFVKAQILATGVFQVAQAPLSTSTIALGGVGWFVN